MSLSLVHVLYVLLPCFIFFLLFFIHTKRIGVLLHYLSKPLRLPPLPRANGSKTFAYTRRSLPFSLHFRNWNALIQVVRLRAQGRLNYVLYEDEYQTCTLIVIRLKRKLFFIANCINKGVSCNLRLQACNALLKDILFTHFYFCRSWLSPTL